jgi:serine/threonine protein kinase
MVKERLGEGQVGIIHKARWRGLDVALKTLKDGLALDSEEHEDLQHELEVLTRHRHPNLVMFIGACTTSQPFMIVCEYMAGGSLESVFLAKKLDKGGHVWRPPRQQVLAWSADLMRALCFLHGCKPKIVHRDLKPSNLLLSSNKCASVYMCVCIHLCMRI